MLSRAARENSRRMRAARLTGSEDVGAAPKWVQAMIESELIDLQADMRAANRVTLDLSTWTRLAELDVYAAIFNVSRATAIQQLVNHGLSHPYWK